MQIVINLTNTKHMTALNRALVRYNQSNGPLSSSAYLEMIVLANLNNLVESYVVTKMDAVQWQRDRFSAEERAAIREEGKTNGDVQERLKALLDQPNAKVDFEDPKVIELLDMLVNLGRLEPRRPSEILAM